MNDLSEEDIMSKNKQKELEKEIIDGQDEAIDENKSTEDIEDTLENEIPEEEVEELDELTKTQQELTDLKDKYLRLYSEFENFRRRTAKEKLDLIQTANEGLLLSLLSVVDDFERANNAYSKNSKISDVKEGIDLIFNKLQNALQQKGLKSMDTKKGAAFDTELHDALTQIPAPSKKLKGKIIDTIEKGYSIGDKVIRHAKVVIGN